MKIGLRIHTTIEGQPPVVTHIVVKDDANPLEEVHKWAKHQREKGYVTMQFDTDDGTLLDSGGMLIAVQCVEVVQWGVIKEGTSQ